MLGRRWSGEAWHRLVFAAYVCAASGSVGGCVGTVTEFGSDGGSASISQPGVDAALPGAASDGGVIFQPGPSIPVGESGTTPLQPVDSGAVIATPDAGNTTPTDTTSSDPCMNEDIRFAKNVSISELALYQVVKVPLVSGGMPVNDRPSPIVQGKRALVRVHVRPESGYSPRTLRAVITLDNGTTQRFVTDLDVRAASTDADLSSTFNFELDGATIGPNTTVRAAVVETTCGGALGSAEAARAPISGTVALNAEAIRKLRVRVVPTVINGNTATPTQQQLEQMRAAMLAYYPVPDVEISVREPYDLSGAWTCASGDGWSCALDAIVSLRSRDAQPSDVYYYAVLTPEATFRAYCGSGCTLGVAYATTNASARYQVGIGVGYTNDLTYDTMVHELGHAHGRQHAPCAPGNSLDPRSIDASYPSSTAETGTWGWDSRTNELHAPDHKDIMSYCDPHWIGNYNYAAIAQRSESVNVSAFVYGAPQALGGETYRNLIVSARGASYGELTEQGTPPGEPLTAEVRSASGSLLARATVYRAALSNETSMFLFVPELPAGANTLVVDGRTITLP